MVDFAANKGKIAFISTVPTDKIKEVYIGSFTMPTAGAFHSKFGTTSVGASLTDKIYTQMIWSDDGGSTWNDGMGRKNTYSGGNLQYYYLMTCYSTTTDIFIAWNNNGFNSSAPAQTINYKVFAFEVA
jgi:hypothetical protein